MTLQENILPSFFSKFKKNEGAKYDQEDEDKVHKMEKSINSPCARPKVLLLLLRNSHTKSVVI